VFARLRVYRELFLAAFRAESQYRGDLLLQILGGKSLAEERPAWQGSVRVDHPGGRAGQGIPAAPAA
jgi:hypothetical protein